MGDLDDLVEMNLISSARGGAKRAAPCAMTVLRPLTEQDYQVLQNPPTKGLGTSPLVKLRTSHHHLARLLSSGCKPQEASAITGYSSSRISILQNDPAFQELMAYYKEQVEAKYLDVHERLAVLGGSVIDVIQERMEDPDEVDKMTTAALIDVAEFAFDRSIAPSKGVGKSSGIGGGVGFNVTLNFDTGRPAATEGATILDITPKKED